MSAEADNNDNHWPGYVDALTTMTMVLTFVMMILGISIFTLSQNVSRNMIETIAKAANLESDSSIPTSEELAARIVRKLEAAKQTPASPSPKQQEVEAKAFTPTEASALRQERIDSIAEASPEPAPSETRVAAEASQLRIVYKPRATQIDPAADAQLAEHLKSIPRLADLTRLEVLAGVDAANLAVSDARRIAFYRAIRIRGELIKHGAQADKVQLKLDANVPGDQVVVRIRP